MCEFHDCNCNGLRGGQTNVTCTYFSTSSRPIDNADVSGTGESTSIT